MSAAAVPVAPVRPPDPARLREVAAMLTAAPQPLGPPADDRAAWRAAAAAPWGRAMLDAAARLAAEPLPDLPDELFLDYSRTGNRTRWQAVAFARRQRLDALALAECLEAQGRFLPALEAVLAALCAERTWVLPAHDGRLTNFHGTLIDVDLASSGLAWNLATADGLLGARLAPATRHLLRERIEARVLAPYRAALGGESRGQIDRWLTGTSNWNAVCIAGCTGAALALVPGRDERAAYVAATERYTLNFLSGFTPDGYCSEGLGYWNYGFGHYALLSETVRRATGGRLDLLARPEARAPATFGARIQLGNGVAPAFADCAVTAKPAPGLMGLLRSRLRGEAPAACAADGERRRLVEWLVLGFPAATAAVARGGDDDGTGERSWFGDAGVLIARPVPGSACRLAVALKGGHNAEHHNHNDVGSYVVAVDGRPVLLDPGGETYTARTFSARRYESRLLNSWGHPVPLVAGGLQRTGREAAAVVRRAEFGADRDTLVLDLAAAYDCGALRRLERAFDYRRSGTGALRVLDRVAFGTPQAFGTALITLGACEPLGEGLLRVRDGGRAVRVTVRATGGAVAVTTQPIEEDAPVRPTRIGIDFVRPVTDGCIELTIEPEEGTR